ncbi:MAG: fused MFS/spermidine synthase [Chloroflexota bacterium]|nr:fused MFS/spermidine synthase [Chloroflexota bacterium]
MLGLLVVVAGMASMAVEMGAARLLAPFFGSSLYIWGILIGLVLVYLTAGYWLGGRLADRVPRREVLLYGLVAAALAIGLVAVVAWPVLGLALAGTEHLPFGLFWGAFLACLLLFSAPTILLGGVNPFAIRLAVERVEAAGNAAGSVFGLTTVGSLIGTFSTVFLLIPTFGTRATLLLFAALLLLVSLLALRLWPATHGPPARLQ